MIKREKTPQPKKAIKPARTVKSAKPAREAKPVKKAITVNPEKAMKKPAATGEKLDLTTVQEEIRERAHQLFLERGDKAGDDVSDWLQAEQEIKKKYKLA